MIHQRERQEESREIHLNPDCILFKRFRWNCSVFEVIKAAKVLVIELKVVQVNGCEKFHRV